MEADMKKGWYSSTAGNNSYWPAAKQDQSARQATAFITAAVANGPIGDGTRDHGEPSHERASVSVPPDWPTALQDVWLKQATPLRELAVLNVELGLGVRVSCWPFHVSMNVVVGPVPVLVDAPTSSQNDTPAHDTEENEFPSVPGPAAAVTCDHALPFHSSTSGPGPVDGPCCPAARQKERLTQETELTWL